MPFLALADITDGFLTKNLYDIPLPHLHIILRICLSLQTITIIKETKHDIDV